MLHTAQVGGTERLLLGVGWGHRGEERMQGIESMAMEDRTSPCRWAWRTNLRVLVTLKDLPSRPASIISLPPFCLSVARHPLSGGNPAYLQDGRKSK